MSASMAVVNRTLGATACGQFFPVILICSAFMTLGSALNNVIVPIMYQYVSHGDLEQLRSRTFQAMRLTAFVLGIPVILVCGFAIPILTLWLGGDFVFLWPIVWMVVLSMHFGRILFLPFSHVYRGMNRVQFPSYVNLVSGLANLVLVYFLLAHTNLGLLGFGLAFTFCFGLRGVLVNSLYCDHVLHLPRGKCLTRMFPSFAVPVVAGVILFRLNLSAQSVPQMVLLVIPTFVLCLALSALSELTSSDRRLLYRVIRESVILSRPADEDKK
jgi:O-antigen/teichoic acid export membrane protein